MSVNIYLKPEVTQLSGFELVEEGPRLGKISGLAILFEGDRPYVMSASESGRVPELLADYVDEYSVRDSFPAYAGREMGVYEYESARATVDLIDYGSSKKSALQHRICLTAKKMEDARELVHLFRIGKLRPVESYEGPIDGRSYAELVAEVERLKEHLLLQEKLSNSSARCIGNVYQYLLRAREAIKNQQSFFGRIPTKAALAALEHIEQLLKDTRFA